MQIYMTVNRLNGKFYIGKNKTSHPRYLGSGKVIKRAIRLYGWWNFYKVILEEVETVKELNKRERYWIAYYRRLRAHLMYNITPGGEWGDTFTHHPDKEKLRKALSDRQKANWEDEDYRKRVSDGNKAKWLDDEYIKKQKAARDDDDFRQNLSDKQKAKWEDEAYRKNLSDKAKARWQDTEFLVKISDKWEDADFVKTQSENLKERWKDEEFKQKHSDKIRLKWQDPEFRKLKPNSKKTVIVDDVRYDSITDATIKLKLSRTRLRNRILSDSYPEYSFET